MKTLEPWSYVLACVCPHRQSSAVWDITEVVHEAAASWFVVQAHLTWTHRDTFANEERHS